MSTEKEFLSLEEIARLLDVHYQLIYKIVRSGVLPASRVGKVYRVSRKDLDAYLEKSKAGLAGTRCECCGKTYQSRLSVQHACRDCGAPICNDCWTRARIRLCAEHGGKRKD